MALNTTNMMMVPSDNLDGYIRAINSIPLLTEKEEYELESKLRNDNNLEAARKLVLSHLRFVVSIARGYMGYGLPLADLIQEGTVGLMKAVKRFDLSQGVRLAAFAVHWIKAEINDYVIKNWRLVKVATTKAQRKLFFKLRQAKKNIAWFNDKEAEKVADNLGVSPRDVTEMETRLTAQDVAYDGLLEDDDDSNSPQVPANFLVDKGSDIAGNLERTDSEKHMAYSLNKVLGALDERSYRIIKARWLDDNKATLQDLAEEFGVSIERVRQLEKAALTKIKKLMVSEHNDVLVA
ncbi:RNA polymerase sigma factor RpoH [Succinimonas amylolytica]|uniref:RNA polymerase sigma factor RpoH n=1 Tax=Succinimonas amylolytica TaxID=83769 RepID=UPI00047642AE|nr:RNA polymerase sigma factor RpoH [Succinimonas amylolytica]